MANTETPKKSWFFNVKQYRSGETERVLNIPHLIITGIIALFALVVVFNTFAIVGPNERGIKMTLGKASEQVLEPGLTFKAPFFQSVQKYSIVPNKLAIDIPINDGGAISKDNQIIGARLVVYWNYAPDRVYDAATRYSKTAIENMLASESNASMKTAIGKRSIYDLAMEQTTIGEEVLASIKNKIASYPITVTQLNLSNINWSQEFDRQIQETMNRTQQVKQAEQEANIAEQTNRQRVIQAEAEAQAVQAAAQGRLNAAKLDAEAQIATAQATAEANRLLTQGENFAYQKAKWQYEIDLARAQKWNGRDTPNFIPLTPTGALVSMPTDSGK